MLSALAITSISIHNLVLSRIAINRNRIAVDPDPLPLPLPPPLLLLGAHFRFSAALGDAHQRVFKFATLRGFENMHMRVGVS